MIHLKTFIDLCFLRSRITNAKSNIQKLNNFDHGMVIYVYFKSVISTKIVQSKSLKINDTHRENCVLINSVQEFIEIEA